MELRSSNRNLKLLSWYEADTRVVSSFFCLHFLLPFAIIIFFCEFVCYCALWAFLVCDRCWLRCGVVWCGCCWCVCRCWWWCCCHSWWCCLCMFCHRCICSEWWGAGMVICLERGADLHIAQLMPQPLTVSCCSKIQIGFIFLVPAHMGRPGQRAIQRVCVCVCACIPLYNSWAESILWQ